MPFKDICTYINGKAPGLGVMFYEKYLGKRPTKGLVQFLLVYCGLFLMIALIFFLEIKGFLIGLGMLIVGYIWSTIDSVVLSFKALKEAYGQRPYSEIFFKYGRTPLISFKEYETYLKKLGAFFVILYGVGIGTAIITKKIKNGISQFFLTIGGLALMICMPLISSLLALSLHLLIAGLLVGLAMVVAGWIWIAFDALAYGEKILSSIFERPETARS